jgi:hypothetical protein
MEIKTVGTEGSWIAGRTPFFSFSPLLAGFACACFIGLMIHGILLGPFGARDSGAASGGEDLSCYRRIVERVQEGQGYYEAAYQELKRLYPIQSVFNWRLPYLAWAMGQTPHLLTVQVLGIIFSLFSIWLWFDLSRDALGFPAAAAGALLLLGAPIYGFSSDVFLAHEFWAGTLITLSLFAYAKGWRWAAIGFGIVGLMIRELVLPYAALMLFISFREKKIWEAALWSVGILLFVVAMAVHLMHVRAYVDGSAGAVSPWIAFGGWKFVLATCSVHPYFFLLPSWLTAVLVPLALMGLLGWTGPLGSRIGTTVLIYMTLFLFVGQSFNRYWGAVYVNLLPLGLLFAPAAIGDLFRSARKQSDPDRLIR